MTQTDSDRNWLNHIADERELVSYSPRLRDIASRLGKLDGWREYDINLRSHLGFVIARKNDQDYIISNADLLDSIPDEPKPETPAQKYERITGKKAYYFSKLLGEEIPTIDYVAWLEADKPDDWPKNKGE
jgi:hypothetical protein